jgi:hypothetical protein
MGLRLVGCFLRPSIVRHGLATVIMTRNPRGQAAAAAALGHRGTRMVEMHYDQSDIEIATAEWQRILDEDLRRGS